MCNIDIENDVIKNIKQDLIDNYSNKKVAFITTKSIFYRNKNFLMDLKNLPLFLEVYFLDDCVKCNKFFLMDLDSKIQSCDYILTFGNGNLVDLVKIYAQNKGVEYSIILYEVTSPFIIENFSNYCDADELLKENIVSPPRAIYADIEVINCTSNRIIANVFANILSINLIMLKMMYDNVDLIKIENLNLKLKEINMFTSMNIMTKEGKVKLLKLSLEIGIILNNFKIYNSIYKLSALYNKYYNHSNEMLVGETNLIFSFIILKMYDCLINNKLKFKPININDRIKRLKTLFNKNSIIENTINDLKNAEDGLEIVKIEKKKFQKYTLLGLNRIGKNLNMFKNMYYDKGVIFNKINLQEFYNIISLAGDVVDEKYLKILRNLGMIDLI